MSYNLFFSFYHIQGIRAYVRFLMPIHVDLGFVQADSCESAFILLYVAIQLDQHHLLKILSYLQCTFLSLGKKPDIHVDPEKCRPISTLHGGYSNDCSVELQVQTQDVIAWFF